jgi:hypothetical protein
MWVAKQTTRRYGPSGAALLLNAPFKILQYYPLQGNVQGGVIKGYPYISPTGIPMCFPYGKYFRSAAKVKTPLHGGKAGFGLKKKKSRI